MKVYQTEYWRGLTQQIGAAPERAYYILTLRLDVWDLEGHKQHATSLFPYSFHYKD
jgi:hypothetical protein